LQRGREKKAASNCYNPGDLSNATTQTSERSLPLFLVLSLSLLSLLSLAFFVKRARGDVLALRPELHIKN
jgi:hypothetical protein